MLFIILCYAVFALVIIGLLIYVIVKRIDDSSKETFEKRDN